MRKSFNFRRFGHLLFTAVLLILLRLLLLRLLLLLLILFLAFGHGLFRLVQLLGGLLLRVGSGFHIAFFKRLLRLLLGVTSLLKLLFRVGFFS